SPAVIRLEKAPFRQYRKMSDSFQFQEAGLPWNSDNKLTSPTAMSLQKQDAPLSDPRSALAGLAAPLASLKGLGSRGESLLGKVLAKPLTPPRVIDLLWHLPSGYVERQQLASVAQAEPGAVVTVAVTPVKYNAPPKAAARAPLRVVCEDESATVDIVFFHGD